MKRFTQWAGLMWQPLLAVICASLVVALLLGFHLGSLTHGASQPEVTYITSLKSGMSIWHNPLFAPHKVLVYTLFKLHVHRVALYRAISAAFGAAAVVSCFLILREWYTLRTALLSTWLFLASAWVLHVARLATPEASFLLVLPLLGLALWMTLTTRHKTAVALLGIAVAASIYIPGFIWLIALIGVWQQRRIRHEIKLVPVWFQCVAGALVVIMLLPLVVAMAHTPQLGLELLGLPVHFPGVHQALLNALHVPGYLFVRGPGDPVRWLGHVPLLDVFSTAMFALGLYRLRYHLKLLRTRVFVGGGLLLAILCALGGPVTVTILIPLIYLMIAGGLAFMLNQWLTVFPRNPVAHTLATTLLSIGVLFATFYHLNHYFIAWPQTPATRAAFNKRLP